MATPRKKGKKKFRKNVPVGVAHIKATFNNTIITITDLDGNALAWCSSGSKGFKGSRKSTPFAATVAAEEAAKKAMEYGVNSLTVYIKGPGSGGEAALRTFQAAGLQIKYNHGVTPTPHNGCRPPTPHREGKNNTE